MIARENVVNLPKSDLELLVDEWMADLQVAGRAKKTRKSYEDSLRLFRKRTGIRSLEQFDARAIKRYLVDIEEGAYPDQPRGPASQSTKHLHWRSFRALVGWGLQQVNPPAFHASLIDVRPGVKRWFTIPEPTVDEDVVDCYTPAEIRKIEEAGKRYQGRVDADGHPAFLKKLAIDRRYQAIMHTFHGTGMRISELLSRELEDLIENPDERPGDDDARAFFKLPKDSKTHKARYTPVSNRLYRDLMAYLRERPKTSCQRFFVDAKGKPIKQHAVNDYCERLGQRIGVRVRPHRFRHTWATDFLKRRPGDIETLRRIGGWRNYKMIERYVHYSLEMLGKDWGNAAPY
jgi:integrase